MLIGFPTCFATTSLMVKDIFVAFSKCHQRLWRIVADSSHAGQQSIKSKLNTPEKDKATTQNISGKNH